MGTVMRSEQSWCPDLQWFGRRSVWGRVSEKEEHMMGTVMRSEQSWCPDLDSGLAEGLCGALEEAETFPQVRLSFVKRSPPSLLCHS